MFVCLGERAIVYDFHSVFGKNLHAGLMSLDAGHSGIFKFVHKSKIL